MPITSPSWKKSNTSALTAVLFGQVKQNVKVFLETINTSLISASFDQKLKNKKETDKTYQVNKRSSRIPILDASMKDRHKDNLNKKYYMI